jgi:hypothetical protein
MKNYPIKMELDEKNQVELIIKKQRKMGKLLLKEIKNDPPKDKRKSFASLSDSITLKYMNFLNSGKEIKTEGKVQQKALDYAKSIMEAKKLMTELVAKQKTFKEKRTLLAEWDTIERNVNQMNKKEEKKEKHWSDILDE